MTVGDRIKFHRKRCDMTQSQLAEALGVSVQAISKWETNSGLPDLSLIVPLARVLNITTDDLLTHGNRREDFENLWKETLRTFGDDPEHLLPVAKSALEVFPKDITFLYRCAVDEYRLSDLTQNEARKQYLLGQAIYHANKALEQDPDFESAKQLVAQAYAKSGRPDAAKAAAYKCDDVDTALKNCLEGEELRQHRQKLIDKALKSLLKELMWDDIPSLDAAERIIHAALPDKNFLYYNSTLMFINLRRGDYYIKNNEHEKGLNAFKSAFEYVKKDKKREIGTEESFTESLFELLKYKRDEGIPGLSEQFLNHLMNKNCFVRQEDFKALKIAACGEFLKTRGIAFEKGLSDEDFKKIEEIYSVTFPKSLKELLSEFLPVSPDEENGFPNWADFSEGNIKNIKKRMENPKEWVLRDVEFGFWHYTFGKKPDDIQKALEIAAEKIESAPKMIPVYFHRYVPVVEGVDDPPVFSTVGRDTVIYGNDVIEYFLSEFSNVKRKIKQSSYGGIPFWGMLAE